MKNCLADALTPCEADTERPHLTWLRARDFTSLATSRRKLYRADSPGGVMRGLLDPETGELFVIETYRLSVQGR